MCEFTTPDHRGANPLITFPLHSRCIISWPKPPAMIQTSQTPLCVFTSVLSLSFLSHKLDSCDLLSGQRHWLLCRHVQSAARSGWKCLEGVMQITTRDSRRNPRLNPALGCFSHMVPHLCVLLTVKGWKIYVIHMNNSNWFQGFFFTFNLNLSV